MYTYDQVLHGLSHYLDKEIVSKVAGWQRWLVGTGLAIALERGDKMFEDIKHNYIIKSLELVDDNDMIDVEEIYHHLRDEANKGPITIDMPVIGKVTLNVSDVDMIYKCITNRED